PGHHANMMLPHYDEIGIGVACDPSTGNYYYSMELGTPSQSEGLDQTAALPEPLQLGEVADEAPTGSDISGFGTAPTPQVSAVHCPGTLPSRLLAGGEGRIIPTGSPNRLRNQPSLNGAILTRVPGGGVFAILDGP